MDGETLRRLSALTLLTLSVLSAACRGSQPVASAGTAKLTIKFASLDGAQETPGVTTTAFGAGILTVNESNGHVSGFIATSGLVNPTAAHVHDAARGAAGPIIVPLSGGPDLWVVPDNATPLTASQIADFTAGNLYFNAHAAANPTGEIRGQIDKSGAVGFALLDGAQETPGVTTTAFGAGILSVNESNGQISGFIATSGLVNPTAAYVYNEEFGVTGPIVVPMTGGPSIWVVPDSATPLPALQIGDFVDDLMMGNFYFNALTAANPNGEIRGQIDKSGTARLASLDGAQEVPPATTTAFGAGILFVNESWGGVSGFIATSGLVNPMAAHVHYAARRVAGQTVVPLTGGPSIWIVPNLATPLTVPQIADFLEGQLYFNAITAANPNGEIRGQIE